MNDTGGIGLSNETLCRPAVYEQLAQGEHELRRAFEAATSRIVPPETELLSRERRGDALYALRRGWACRVAEWPDGHCAIREIHAPGDIIGVGSVLRARPADVVMTVQPSTVRVIDGAVVERLLASPPVFAYLAWLMCDAQLRAERRADMLARRSARERVAAMLLEIYERLRRRGLIQSTSYNLPLTQQQIGDHLGLTVVHVNRTLRMLREEKIVILDHHVVMIRDLGQLQALARGTSGSAFEKTASDETAIAARLAGLHRPAGDDE